MRAFFFITVAALVSYVRMETCPSAEDISPCFCSEYVQPLGSYVNIGDLDVFCLLDKSLNDQGVLKKVLSSLSGKQNVHLRLESFNLGRVPSDFFSGIGIKNLMIERCPLETLSEGGGSALQGLEDTLEQLDIDGSLTGDNVPREIEYERFKRLNSVSFQDNNITEVGDDWFKEGSTSLQSITISDNVEKVGSNAFAKLVNLKYLYLSGIKQIQRSVLPNPADHLESVQIYNKQDNAVIELPEDIFTAMPALRLVQVKNFGITTLDERVWSPVWQHLKSVFLGGNPIRCDDHMSWLFNQHAPRTIFGECDSPKEQRGKRIEVFIESKKQ